MLVIWQAIYGKGSGALDCDELSDLSADEGDGGNALDLELDLDMDD